MIIKDIRHSDTNTTRADGRYPLRIGSEVEFYDEPIVGQPMILTYISDNKGQPKDGYLRSSTVLSIRETCGSIIVETRNSVYYFDK